jgi:hypothetical protein
LSTEATSAPHFLNRHADAPALDAPVLHELRLDVGRDVDRDRERDALVAAASRIDLRVDADHLSLEIEERPARVSGIDRGVGLDEGRADREHPFAHLHRARIAELDGGKPGRVDLHHRDVGRLVGAEHLALELAPVDEAHAHFIGAFHHVRIGEDHAVRLDDEARAHALARRSRAASEPAPPERRL